MTTTMKSTAARPRQRRRHGTALFMAVTGTTMIVSVLGLSAMAIVRIERRQATAINNRQLARSHARSAVELALQQINSDASWRTTYTSGLETTLRSLGSNSTGSISWILKDADNSLTNPDNLLRLKGIGRIGNTVQVSSVEVRAGEVSTLLRSYEVANDAGMSINDLQSNKWWGQYFKPTLPANANGWVITSAQVRIRRDTTNRVFQVRVYSAGGGAVPTGTVIESVSVNSASVPAGWNWYAVPFAGATWLDKNQAVTLALETSSGSAPVEVSYRASGVSAANSGLLRGDPDWESFETDASLQYRVNGIYTTSDNVGAVAGSWLWDVP